MRNEDLDRLESLCREIARTPASRRTDKALWDCVERLAQKVLVLRLQFESQRWNSECRAILAPTQTFLLSC